MQHVLSTFGRRLLCVACTVASAVAGTMGCGPGPEKGLTSRDPSGKIPAMKEAVRVHDLRATPQLVKALESDDAAVRFYAIEALYRLTGETFGYVYYQNEEGREPALKKWKDWLARQPQPKK
jgi:hypothetical protein